MLKRIQTIIAARTCWGRHCYPRHANRRAAAHGGWGQRLPGNILLPVAVYVQ